MKKTDHRGLCGNENSHTLLVGVKSAVAALADRVTVPYKHTHVPAIRLSHSAPRYFCNRNESVCLYTCVQSSFICKNKNSRLASLCMLRNST